MADGLMNALRHALGLDREAESTSDEQREVEAKLERIGKRIEQRQKALDIQSQVLAADRRDARRR